MGHNYNHKCFIKFGMNIYTRFMKEFQNVYTGNDTLQY